MLTKDSNADNSSPNTSPNSKSKPKTKVVLTSGWDVEISIRAFFLYKSLSGVPWVPYTNPEGATGDMLVRIDEEELDAEYSYYEPHYEIVDQDHGKFISESVCMEHRVGDAFDDRADPHLIQTLETLGDDALGLCSLYIAELPDDVEE